MTLYDLIDMMFF